MDSSSEIEIVNTLLESVGVPHMKTPAGTIYGGSNGSRFTIEEENGALNIGFFKKTAEQVAHLAAVGNGFAENVTKERYYKSKNLTKYVTACKTVIWSDVQPTFCTSCGKVLRLANDEEQKSVPNNTEIASEKE